jgi:hypothetical protein
MAWIVKAGLSGEQGSVKNVLTHKHAMGIRNTTTVKGKHRSKRKNLNDEPHTKGKTVRRRYKGDQISQRKQKRRLAHRHTIK